MNPRRQREFEEWARTPGGVYWEVTHYREEGNRVINQVPHEAIMFYSRAIEIVSRHQPFTFLSPREMATLHSNRCTALTRIRELGLAFDDAIACIQIDPTFQKGYWRAATVMKQMDKEDEALEALIDGYPRILGTDKRALADRVDFVYEITVLATRLWEKWKKSQYLFRLFDVPTSVWTLVVQRLAKNKEYEGLRLVFLMGGTQSGTVIEIGQGGSATGCDTSQIDLHPLVCGFSRSHDTWSMHLVLELIKHGSRVEGLSQKEGDTPLHCAVHNALRTGCTRLLQYLFTEVYTINERRNLPDRFGDSLFHVVAKTSGLVTHAKTVVGILRKYEVDPSRTDRRGCRPVDVAPAKNMELCGLLNTVLMVWEQEQRQKLQQERQRKQQQQQQQQNIFSGQSRSGIRFSTPEDWNRAGFYEPHLAQAQPQLQPRILAQPQIQAQPRMQSHPRLQGQPQPRPRAQFFDPSRIFGTPQTQPRNPPPFFDPSKVFGNQPYQTQQPIRPQPFFDHSRIFANQQEEQIKKQKAEQQRQEQLRQQEETRKHEEAVRRQKEQEQRRQELERVLKQRDREEAERQKQRQREAEQRERLRLEEQQKQKEREAKDRQRKDRVRFRKEEKKRKENQKRQEKWEAQRKKEEEAKQNAYQKGLTLKDQGKHDEAVGLFLEFIGKEHNNLVIYRDVDRCVAAFLESLDRVQEIPDTVKCPAPATFWNGTVQQLANDKKWWSLFLLLVGGSYNANRNSCGIAHGCDASGVSIVAFLDQWEGLTMTPPRSTMVRALLESNARPNGLVADRVTPLVYCIKAETYELVHLLLMHGAFPYLLVVDPGDTPLHSALKICFKQDDRKFAILDLLLNKYTSDPTDANYLDRNAQDRSGNTLFHLALTGGSKNQSLNAVKLLSSHHLNPRLRNHGGKVALEMVSNKDRRYLYLAEAAKYYRESSGAMPKIPKDANQGMFDGINVYGTPDDLTKQESAAPSRDGHHPHPFKSTERLPRREQLRCEVGELLSIIPVFVPEQLGLNDAVRMSSPTMATSPPRTGLRQLENEKSPRRNNKLKEPEHIDEVDEETEEEEDEEEEEAMAIDATIFDDLIWEVECTAKVWKFLRDKQVLHSLKETAIRKVQMLGNGDWRGRLCKPLEGLPKQRNMKLYEARLTKGGRILWELAIAFSPRCSEECEKRLESGDGLSEGTAVAGGRVYSEIIRIWDIVPDHPKVSHAIEVIVKSVERGEECIIRKNLVGISNKETAAASTVQRLPTFFREVTGNSPDRKSTPNDVKKVPRPFFPPASSRENEYHIMKFYSVTSTLVNAVLNESNIKVDFPFRVTELEHAIINLQPKPPSSILLLGRSGTGKTTCCLYRMWTKFFKYWKQASEIGEPWIPRDIAFIHQDNADDEEDLNGNEYDMNGATNSALLNGMSGEGDASDSTPTIMDHLHQVFITKNAVLCSEVQRNFCDMSHACEFAGEPLAQQDTPIPHRFQDAHQARFPLFLSSRQFILLLDASLPNPYFPRAADGSLKRKIKGWDEEDGPLTFIPLMDDEEDEEQDNAEQTNDDETNPEGALEDDNDPINAGLLVGQHDNPRVAPATKYDPRREVTYEFFAYELWPRINKKKLPYHPTLVWMEIASFIKGSVEALHTDSGCLSLEDYKTLGHKRASNFSADREEIYNLFNLYQHVKKQKSLFDEGDLVFDVYRRLRDVKELDWVLHEIYVDETQDFTQAELSLFIRCSHDPNSLFLTGDTAQSIMRGVAFRFDDLKSLFHYASKSVKALGKHSAVTVPKRVYQLTHNYRSHAGILNLASTIVDLMAHFFPNSFDRLERDQGLFHGPSPVLLESCSFSDLALLLCGNKRKTSEIEFGAHQVILVANEEAIEKLPAELKVGLVMTIYEAKGLEFDDVLLYNFFKDSPADKEWRVITEYLDELISLQQNQTDGPSEELKQIDIESLARRGRPRPLRFNPDEHKVLNSELKYLYTAITRARVNVWIFDEDETKRAPMFEFFRCRSLVEVIRPEKQDKDDNPDLDRMFVEKSTPAEWIKRGDYFFQNKLWMVAAKCFHRGGHKKKELQAKAHYQAMEAERMRDQLHAMREKFLLAASLFLQADCSKMAVNCLYNAREFILLAQLLEKRGEFSKAAKIYEMKLNRISDACRCLELMGDYAKALDLLCSIGLHSKALDVVDRFNRFKQEQERKGRALPRNIKPPGSTHSLDEMIYKSAEYHYKHQDKGQMLDALVQLDQFEARVNFLRKRGLFEEAVTMLKGEGKVLEAAKILREQGKLEEACTILESSDAVEFVAECLLSRARKLVIEAGDDQNPAEAIALLTKADALFCKSGETAAKAEAKLLLGQLQKDAEKIKEANRVFNRLPHYAGESECIDHLIMLSPPTATTIKCRVFQQLRNLQRLIIALFECKVQGEEHQRKLCEDFYGLVPLEGDRLRIHRCEGARVLTVLGKNEQEASEIDAEKARHKIAKKCLIPRALRWLKGIRELLRNEWIKLTQCEDYVIGNPCSKAPESCHKMHEPYSSHHVFELVQCLVHLIEVDDIVEQVSKISGFKSADKLTAEVPKVEKTKPKKCRALLDVFFPQHCHPRIIGGTTADTQQILGLVRTSIIRKQLKAFAEKEQKNVDPRHQRADTNLYLMCHSVHMLIGESSDVITKWVAQEELDCLKWQQREGWRHPRPLGMHPVHVSQPRGIFKSYKRSHLESHKMVYSPGGNAMASLSEFNRFMGTLVNKPFEPLLPSISNTVAVIEAKLTMMLALGAKMYHCAVVIPASYLAQATFFDVACSPRQGHAMYNTVNRTSNLVTDKVHKLVDFMCGTRHSGRKFNVLADAFTNVEYIQTGEAERSLVLVLVMLCNAGLGLPIPVIKDTLTALQSIAPSKDYLPPRVYKALHSIQIAMSRHDALWTLQELLAARENEYLRECRWNQHMPPRGAPGLGFSNINIKTFKNLEFERLRPRSPSVFTEEFEGKGHTRGGAEPEADERERPSSGFEEEDEAGAEQEVSAEEAEKIIMEQDKLQKEKAIKTIVDFLKYKRILRLANLLRSKGCNRIVVKRDSQSLSENAASDWVSKQLVAFRHLDVRCILCDAELRSSQDTKPAQLDEASELEEDAQNIIDELPTTEEAATSPDAEQEIKNDLPTRAEHEATPFHQERHRQFMQYGCLLRDEVYPLYTDAERLQKELSFPSLNTEAPGNRSNLQYLEENLSLCLKALEAKMEAIQSKRAFEQLEEVRHAVQRVDEACRQIKERFQKQDQQDQATAAEREDGIMAADNAEDDTLTIEMENDAAEDRVLPVAEQPEDIKDFRKRGKNQKNRGKWNRRMGRKR